MNWYFLLLRDWTLCSDALFALFFNNANKLFCILFCLGIRKGVTTVVPNLFIVQVSCQCRYVRSVPVSQFEWFYCLDFIVRLQVSDHLTWIPDSHTVCRDWFCHNTSGTNHTSCSYCYACQNYTAATNPHIVLYGNRKRSCTEKDLMVVWQK